MRTTTRMTLAAGAAVALGAVPVGAVFEEWRWIWYTWAAIATVVTAHLLARSLRVPAALVPVAGALGLLVYLTVVFTSADALLGLIPTPGSLDALWRDVGTGLEDVNDLAAPVPATPGLILLTAASIGAIALVVDVVAVAMRRPAAAGLALLALYAVPTAVARNGVPWILFAIGACGYLLMLLVEGRDRLLRWGRPVGTAPAAYGPRASDDDAPLPLTGQRIGAFAIALAVVVPLLVPGLTGNALSRLGRTGTGDSAGGTGALSEFAELRGQLRRNDPVELMRVTTDLEKPDYLRTKVLDRYRNGGFLSSDENSDDPLPGKVQPPSGQVPGTGASTAYELTVRLTDNYNDDHIPTYLAPSRVEDVDGSWGYDRGHAVVRNNDRGGNFQYRVTGALPDPDPSALEALGAGDPGTDEVGTSATQLPRTPLPPLIKQTVDKVVAGQTSAFGRAYALQNYFLDERNGFGYSLQTDEGNSGNALQDFLTKKRGYCEQYAAAMAVMLRQVGVPSRVALGYLPGTKVEGNTYSVTTNDAHAWVEAYIDGYGWLRFDPTPVSGGRAVTPGYAPGPSPSPTPSTSSTASGSGATGSAPNLLPDEDLAADGGDASLTDTGLITPRRLGIGAGVLAILIALLAPAVVRLATRRRRLRTASGSDSLDAARAAWDEVVGSAADYGVPVAGTETPRGLARRLSHDLALDPSATAGLRLVALAEERARYAPRAGVDGDLPTAVRAVRRGLRTHADRRRRWQAVLLPPSTVRAARTGSAARSVTASAALSRLGESVRRPVTPRRR